MAEERLQKILARAGYASRRASEELISAGRVKVNGQTAVLGTKADPQRDTITVDNQPIAKAQELVYIALHKPVGVLSEVSPEEPRQTVRDLVPVPGHLFMVGRLDLESEGLILLTNDGELANKLSHPRYGHEKEYRVLVGTRPDTRQLDAWKHGVVLEDGYRTAPARVRLETVAGKGAWLRVVLREGRKRQIREMGRLTGVPVLRILRLRIGSLLLGDLKPGEWRYLRPDEVRALRVNKPYREGTGDRTPRGERLSRGERPAPKVERTPREDRAQGESGRPARDGSRSPRSGPRPPGQGSPRRARDGVRPSRPGGSTSRSGERAERGSERPPRSGKRPGGASRGPGREPRNRP